MKEYLKNYREEIDQLLKTKEKIDKKVIENHLIKIQFFQHERLIHLLVTCFYAIFALFFLAMSLLTPIFIPIVLIFLIFLIFYVIHYFFLENSVQYLYKQYDKMKDKEK